MDCDYLLFSNMEVKSKIKFRAFLLLFSRLFLFAFFQIIIAFLLHSWIESEKYWMLTATFTNIISIVILIRLYKSEDSKYLSIFNFSKKQRKKDLLIFVGLTLISIPLVTIPSFTLSTVFWGNSTHYHQILLQPLPIYLIYFLLIAFPVTIGFAELATYFGYIMPRLGKQIQPKWLVVLLPVLSLSIQHCTLPLVFDLKFIMFRALMYLPFALMIGVAIHKRPTLFPYLAIMHGLLDFLAVITLLANVG